jgi:hypothetical protein
MDIDVGQEVLMGSSPSIGRLPLWHGQETPDGGNVEIIKNRAVV